MNSFYKLCTLRIDFRTNVCHNIFVTVPYTGTGRGDSTEFTMLNKKFISSCAELNSTLLEISRALMYP